MTTIQHDGDDDRLVSDRFLFRMTATIGVIAALAAAVTIAGQRMGETISRGGHTSSRAVHHVRIGQDLLMLPANMMRFEAQRKSNTAETVNLYLAWPSLEGYSKETADLFSNPSRSNDLVFVDFSQSVMSRDMSGRIEPIYSKLFEGPPTPGPAGLQAHSMSARSGFGSERLFTGTLEDGRRYGVRCMIPAHPDLATAADCQRDVQVGRDLTMLYRFSSRLLPQWQAIEHKLVNFATRHIADPASRPGTP